MTAATPLPQQRRATRIEVTVPAALRAVLEHRTTPFYAGSVSYECPMKPHGWQPMTNAALVQLMAATLDRGRGSP